MARLPNERNFQADIPKPLWEEFEQWLRARTKLSNRQIMTGMFRLFLAMPEELRLLSFYGETSDLQRRGKIIEEILYPLDRGEEDRIRRAVRAAAARPAGQSETKATESPKGEPARTVRHQRKSG